MFVSVQIPPTAARAILDTEAEALNVLLTVVGPDRGCRSKSRAAAHGTAGLRSRGRDLDPAGGNSAGRAAGLLRRCGGCGQSWCPRRASDSGGPGRGPPRTGR
ncbi:hypothetical protein EEB14_25695 [Rhodococcus sp. WS4]|nr:hypothetical protein EEB14_25695 [Rhodococcus sp. WS4]